MIISELLKDVFLPIIGFTYRKNYYQWKSKYLKKLKRYKDVHQGEDCFIIGNGPSLKNMDLNLLKYYHTFGLNRCNLLCDLFDISFSYHVCVDDLVLKNIKDDILQNVFHCPSFVPFELGQQDFLNTSNVEFIHLGGEWTFQKDILRKIHTGNTVTFVAMQLAYFMGFSRVFLIGVDHNWKNVGAAHSSSTLNTDDENHFHPDYFKNKEWKAPDVLGNEVSYALAHYHFLNDDRVIFDATLNGKLDIFPKIEFQDALEIAKMKN